jgi:hypothetical protein
MSVLMGQTIAATNLSMNIRSQHRPCVYCGHVKKLTADHVPPKLLLAEPYTKNLPTVPACWDCNQSFMRDDEYTRNVVARDLRAANSHDAQSKLPAIIRSLERPSAKAFAEYLARKTKRTTILAPDGKPMGEVVEVDRARVNATGARMIRALYFVETGKPLPPDAVVKVGAKASLSPHEPEALEIARVYSMFTDRRDREIGKAFSYVACFGPGLSVWVMLLYDYFFWLGTVDTRSSLNRTCL